MKKTKHGHRWLIIITASAISIALLLWLLRGWVRETAVRGLVDTLYAGRIENTYAHAFPPVNQHLKDYGFVFTSADTQRTNCSADEYKRLSETIGCIVGNESNSLHPDDAYKTNWKAHSRELEDYLFKNNWHKDWNAQQPIDEILDTHPLGGSIGVNYSKDYGKITCILSIIDNPPYPTPYSADKDRFWVTENCHRYFALFGGY